MEQKNEIKNLQELFNWTGNSKTCCIEEIGEEYFVVEAPNNATWQIQFDKNDTIGDIISKMIEQVEKFDADNEFMELLRELTN